MSPAAGPGFDRLRARTPPRPVSLVGEVQPAPGRATRALFSDVPPPAGPVPPPAGPVPSPAGHVPPAAPVGDLEQAASGALRLVLDCGSCGARVALSPTRAVLVLATGVHLPLLALVGVENTSWTRCPACRRHTRGRLTLRRA